MKGKREPYSNRETPIPADAFTCEQCGWASATGRTECPYCKGEQDVKAALLAEEQRRGVIDTEPTWQRQVLAHLDEVLPSLYQAVLLCKDKELLRSLCACIELLRVSQIDLERSE